MEDWKESALEVVHGRLDEPQCWERDVLGTVNVSANASRADELQRRMVGFAAQIVGVSLRLPKTAQGRHISNQILRSGTAVASNYGEARGAESRPDFVHKLRVVLKELNETAVWLELITETSLLTAETTKFLLIENRELCRIIAASLRTARTFQQ